MVLKVVIQQSTFNITYTFACVQIRHNPLSGGYCGEVPPLPIPNREVKPNRADGTAHPRESRSPPTLFSQPLSVSQLREAFLCLRTSERLRICIFAHVFAHHLLHFPKHKTQALMGATRLASEKDAAII